MSLTRPFPVPIQILTRRWGNVTPEKQVILRDWVSEGAMEPSAILDRISNDCIDDDMLRFRRGELQPSTDKMDEAAIVARMLDQSDLPASFKPLGHIIYRAVAYLSSAPFYSHPGSKTPRGLSADEIQPTTKQDVPCNPEKARERSTQNAPVLEYQGTQLQEGYFLNFDGDGDEIFHDVYTTLAATQPGIYSRPTFIVPQDVFLDLAKKLSETLPKLHTLAIPVEEFKTLVTYLLALQFDHPSQPQGEMDLSSYEEAANNVVAMFTRGSDTKLITWPMFDDGIVQVPFLFHPLFRILRWTFLWPLAFDFSGIQNAPSPIPDGTLLPAPRISQLGAMLNDDVNFSQFGRAHAWYNGIGPTGKVLSLALESMPRLSLLVMSGLAAWTNEEYLFCVFRPALSELQQRIKDEEHIWSTNPAERKPPVYWWRDEVHDYIEYYAPGVNKDPVARPLMIILSPAQRVVRLEENACVDQDGVFAAGDHMKIWDNGVASVHNGTESISVRLRAVEIWGETAVSKDEE
ncbi:unnamed protein product [Clonostachys rosea]|uniref:Heterokaryon incompatibility domain-containing protein n=1 Tax=Bionectria ochroleuca TaxID=29856 RepID=A0ABY6U5M6_BIOOC|nr:unnamed protein product [Clonostachys rosea]